MNKAILKCLQPTNRTCQNKQVIANLLQYSQVHHLSLLHKKDNSQNETYAKWCTMRTELTPQNSEIETPAKILKTETNCITKIHSLNTL